MTDPRTTTPSTGNLPAFGHLQYSQGTGPYSATNSGEQQAISPPAVAGANVVFSHLDYAPRSQQH
jgi:hypothetical protein